MSQTLSCLGDEKSKMEIYWIRIKQDKKVIRFKAVESDDFGVLLQ